MPSEQNLYSVKSIQLELSPAELRVLKENLDHPDNPMPLGTCVLLDSIRSKLHFLDERLVAAEKIMEKFPVREA